MILFGVGGFCVSGETKWIRGPSGLFEKESLPLSIEKIVIYNFPGEDSNSLEYLW